MAENRESVDFPHFVSARAPGVLQQQHPLRMMFGPMCHKISIMLYENVLITSYSDNRFFFVIRLCASFMERVID